MIGVVTPALAAYAADDPAENRLTVIKPLWGLTNGKPQAPESPVRWVSVSATLQWRPVQGQASEKAARDVWAIQPSHFARERKAPAGLLVATGSHVAHLEFNHEFRAAARNDCGRRLAR